MIIDFLQTGRQPNPTFEGRSNNVIIFKGVGMTQSSLAYVEIESMSFQLSTSIHREKINGRTATQVTDVLSEGARIGYIFPDVFVQKKILFLSVGYDYFEYKFLDKTYIAYEIGLGPNEHYICIYNSDNTVAIIHKNDIKKNYRDAYTIFLSDQSDLMAISVFAMYFDCIRYPDHGKITGESYVDDSYLTVQKELNEKYDPTFIPRIKAMERNSQ